MKVAAAQREDGLTDFILALTQEDVYALQDGRPIIANMPEPTTVAAMTIMIADDDQSIMDQLRACGKATPDTGPIT